MNVEKIALDRQCIKRPVQNKTVRLVDDLGVVCGDGTSRISLRGLGSSRTLVLLNGHRLPPSSTGLSSTNLGSVVDLNTIPVSMVNRVEVFKDGASAIYGSDAVAGWSTLLPAGTSKDYSSTFRQVQCEKERWIVGCTTIFT